MEYVIESLVQFYNNLIAFFQDIVKSVKTFYQALLDTFKNAWDVVQVYFGNVWKSLMDFLIDIPLLIFKKVWQLLLWLLDWVAQSCSYCMGGSGGAGSLVTAIQGAWDSIAAASPFLMYMISRSGMIQAMQIITCGLTIYAAFKTFMFLKSIVGR